MSHRRAMRGAAVFAGLLLTACGQKGALYLPEATSEVVTRPTQTPGESPPAADAESRPGDEAPPRTPPPP